jgi:hypothetical protein
LYASLTECIVEVASFVETEVVQVFLCVTDTRFLCLHSELWQQMLVSQSVVNCEFALLKWVFVIIMQEYTDRTVSAKTWLADKLHNKNIGTLTSAQWSNLGQLKSSLGDRGPVQVDAATLASHKFVNWLHGNAESNSTHPHNFSVVPMERPGFKSEGKFFLCWDW